MSTYRIRVPLLNYHRGQIAVVRAIREGRRRGIRQFILEAGRRQGKTVLGRDLALRVMLSGGKAGFWVPDGPDGKATWAWFVKALGGEDSPLVSVMNKTSRRIELKCGGELDMWSLDKDGHGRGYTYDIAVIEEAAKAKNLQSALEETIEATTLDTGGYLLIISTPRGNNHFHQLWVKGQSPNHDYLSFRLPSSSNPFLSRDLLKGIKRKLIDAGRRWVWDQEYLAIPADQGVNPFDLKILERQKQKTLTGKRVVVWGLDLAKHKDYTVLVGLDEDRKISYLYRWHKTPWPKTEKMIVEYTTQFPDAPILMDATGIGDPMFDYLVKRELPVRPFKFNTTSRANLLDLYVISFAEGLAWVAPGQHFEELSKAEYTENLGSLKILVPEPEHDDVMMAGALANKLAHDLGYPMMKSVAAPTSFRSDPRKSAPASAHNRNKSFRDYRGLS